MREHRREQSGPSTQVLRAEVFSWQAHCNRFAGRIEAIPCAFWEFRLSAPSVIHALAEDPFSDNVILRCILRCIHRVRILPLTLDDFLPSFTFQDRVIMPEREMRCVNDGMILFGPQPKFDIGKHGRILWRESVAQPFVAEPR